MGPRSLGIALPLLLTAGRSALAQNTPDTATCYRLAYVGDRAAGNNFAEYVAVHTAHDSVIRSGMGPDKRQDFWRMFLIGATWERHQDTLILNFTNGFSGVLYRLTPTGKDSLSGQVAFLYDVVDQSPPPVPVIATRISCETAFIQSPPYTKEDSDRSGRERRLEELRRTEAQRIQRLTSPVAGTYEFTIVLPSSRQVTVYGRTEIHPANPVWSLDDQWNVAPQDTVSSYRAQGYQLRMAVSYARKNLPSVASDDDQPGVCVAYLTIGEQPTHVTSSTTQWRGDLDVLFAASRCASDGPLHDALLRASGAVNDVWFKDIPGQTDGRYVLDKNGRVTVAMDVFRRDAKVVSIIGHRIDSQTATPR
jgi:hypothetical protein